MTTYEKKELLEKANYIIKEIEPLENNLKFEQKTLESIKSN